MHVTGLPGELTSSGDVTTIWFGLKTINQTKLLLQFTSPELVGSPSNPAV